MLEMVQPMLLEDKESQESARMKSLEILRGEEEAEQQGKSAKAEALSAVDPARMKEEITIALMECLNQRWGQWLNRYSAEMNDLREKREKVASWRNAGIVTAPEQGQLKEPDQRTVSTG
ncbi:hypothetical protein Y1Q_0016146 [Alligator mississippiensis]|uniref:Uncharacterized protein n=1 Tax=Alligator mississippiensis TaxID=8496 RepID=A0A151P1H8_ALLMI|nr:hypothetical protein Y1Q_0016146 [Alligator mississippiensis]